MGLAFEASNSSSLYPAVVVEPRESDESRAAERSEAQKSDESDESDESRAAERSEACPDGAPAVGRKATRAMRATRKSAWPWREYPVNQPITDLNWPASWIL